MKNLIILLFLISSCFTSFSQNEKKAEKAALKCINKHLAKANKNVNYLLDAFDQYTGFVSKMNIEKFEQKKQEIDSILSKSGYLKSGYLDFDLLKQCMQKSYHLNNTKNDTTSTYYQLLSHVNYLSKNPSITDELSSTLLIGTLKSIIPDDKKDEPIYKAISLIMWHGYIVKPSSNKKESISLSDFEYHKNDEQFEVVSIVEDNETTEETVSQEDEISDLESDCGEMAFMLVQKMPEYKGGTEALKKFLKVHSSEVKGRVFVSFTVNCHGKVINPKVVRGLTPLADEVALKLIKSMPDWIPGEQSGTAVNVMQTHPIIFD
ncbi:energy transducer TonB [Marinifilum fragile]|uniref:energy transducer TonB n=1 Tax=Marinifilum fragile TaxID=570161 RepID=UPI002AA8EF88|nr:energy transducer TonB [Marinifilum fragile]